MAFYIGSFAGGLFQGAQSASSLINSYYSLQNTMATSDAANKVADAMQPPSDDTTKTQTPPTPPPATQPTSGTAGDDTTTAQPPTTPTAPIVPVKQTPLTVTTSADTGAGGKGAGGGKGAIEGGGSAGGKSGMDTAATKMSAGSGTQADTIDAQRQADLAKYAIFNPANRVGTEALTPSTANDPNYASGQQIYGGAPTPPPGQAPQPTPTPWIGQKIQQGIAALQSPPTSTAPQTPQQMYGGPAPAQLPPAPAPAPAPAPPPPAVAAAPPPAPAPMPSWQQQALARHGYAPPPTPYTQGMPTDGRGNYYDARTQQWTPMPGGQASAPAAPAAGVGFQAAPTQPPAPAPAAAAPAQTLGGRLSSVAGSIGQAIMPSAEAAPARPPAPGQPPPTAAPPPGAQQTALPPSAPVQPQTPAPAPVPAQAAPAPAPAQLQTALPPAKSVEAAPATTAAPPKTAETAPTVAGPVKVEGGGEAGGKGGAVAPGQTTPSVQSQTTPPAIAPPVSPQFWMDMQRTNPALAQQVIKAVDTYGRGVVSYEEVAAIIQRESGGQATIKAADYDSTGSVGLMQVTRDTTRQMELQAGVPPGTWNQATPEGSLNAGVSYIAHLAIDEQLGPHSAQTLYAYGRGPAGAQRAAGNLDAEKQANPVGWKALTQLYPPGTELNQGMFTGGRGGANATPYTAPGIVKAAQDGGPNGVLSYIATTGPQGIGMSDRWHMAQAALIKSAILNGHMDMIPHITDWIAQQSHQGTITNLMAADQALSQGNATQAASYLAKAHAFFPDGTYARFGTDSKGQLWGEQFNEGSGVSMGKPVQITNDMLRQQMIALQNPTNYVQALQQYQKENAAINYTRARGEYYQQMPGIQADKQNQINQRQQEREANARQMQEERLENQRQLAAAKADNQNADLHAANSAVAKDYADNPLQPGETQETLPRQSQIDSILRRNPESGGGAMAGPMARDTARQLVNGEAKLVRGTNQATGQPADAVVGKDGIVRSYISTDQGDRIRGLAGTRKMGAPGTQGAPQRAGGIGGGSGSPQVAMSGLGQSLAGVPTQPLPAAIPVQQPQAAQ